MSIFMQIYIERRYCKAAKYFCIVPQKCIYHLHDDDDIIKN